MGMDGRPLDPFILESIRRILGPMEPPLDPATLDRLRADLPRQQKEYDVARFKSALYDAFTAARSAGLGMDYAARYAARRAQRHAMSLTMSEMLAQLRSLAPLS
jgi:hypothetical protein